MNMTTVMARVSDLAARQWGLLTTAQAEAVSVTRLQLARLAEAAVLERIERGIYGVPAAMDERTPLRAAWLSLYPAEPVEARLAAPVASGVVSHTSAAALHGLGELPEDTPEITLPGRKQSRRHIRLHRSALDDIDVTIAEGLPVTTPARTVADLLRDRHDPSHVAQIAGEVLQRGLATRQAMTKALEPLARRNGQPSGAALLEHLLDLVGMSSAALAGAMAESGLAEAFFAAGRLSALQDPTGSLSRDVLRPLGYTIPKIDMSSFVKAGQFSIPVDTDAFRAVLREAPSAYSPDEVRQAPMERSPSPARATVAAENAEASE